MEQKNRRWTAGLVATGLLAGGIAAGVAGVTAATAAPVLTAATSTSTPNTATTGDAETADDAGGRSDETPVTGAKAATLEAAALKAVPGATVDRIETDADGAAYEAHLTKADGSSVTVQFDASLTQTAIETESGKDAPDSGDGDGEHAAE